VALQTSCVMKRKRSGVSFTNSREMNWKTSTKTKTFDADDPTTKTSTPAKIITSGARAMRNSRSSFHSIVAIHSPIHLSPIAITKTLLSQVQGTGSYPPTTFKSSSPSRYGERRGQLSTDHSSPITDHLLLLIETPSLPTLTQCAPAHFDLSVLPIYVTRVPAAPFTYCYPSQPTASPARTLLCRSSHSLRSSHFS
jgi:hypothetical protein